MWWDHHCDPQNNSFTLGTLTKDFIQNEQQVFRVVDYVCKSFRLLYSPELIQNPTFFCKTLKIWPDNCLNMTLCGIALFGSIICHPIQKFKRANSHCSTNNGHFRIRTPDLLFWPINSTFHQWEYGDRPYKWTESSLGNILNWDDQKFIWCRECMKRLRHLGIVCKALDIQESCRPLPVKSFCFQTEKLDSDTSTISSLAGCNGAVVKEPWIYDKDISSRPKPPAHQVMQAYRHDRDLPYKDWMPISEELKSIMKIRLQHV